MALVMRRVSVGDKSNGESQRRSSTHRRIYAELGCVPAHEKMLGAKLGEHFIQISAKERVRRGLADEIVRRRSDQFGRKPPRLGVLR